MNIHYIANTGFMLVDGKNKILIDGIHHKKVEPYFTIDNDTLNKIILGKPPFDNMGLLLFTHYHWDHFDPDLTLQALKNQPQLSLFSNKALVEHIKSLPNYDKSLDDRIFCDEIDFQEKKDYSINSISFTAINLIHDGDQYINTPHFVYILNLSGGKIFHCGDAKPSESNYKDLDLNSMNLRVALLDFPYITLSSGRSLIKKYIHTEDIIIMHLPREDSDAYLWLNTVKKVAMHYDNDLPKITLCLDTNQPVYF